MNHNIKKLKSPLKFEPIEVEWIDSCFSKNRIWFDKSQYKDWLNESKLICKSVGYFLEFTDDYLSMTTGFAIDKISDTDVASGEIDEIENINIIPIGSIKKITRLCSI